jgi:hypothetical protein
MDITVLLLLLFALQLIIIVYFYNKSNSSNSTNNPKKEEEINHIKIRGLKDVFTDDNTNNHHNYNNHHNNHRNHNNHYNPNVSNVSNVLPTYPYYPQSLYRNYPYYNPGYSYMWDPYILNGCSCGGRCNNCRGGKDSYINNNNVYIKQPSDTSKIYPTQPPPIYPTQPPILPTQPPILPTYPPILPTYAPVLQKEPLVIEFLDVNKDNNN